MLTFDCLQIKSFGRPKPMSVQLTRELGAISGLMADYTAYALIGDILHRLGSSRFSFMFWRDILIQKTGGDRTMDGRGAEQSVADTQSWCDRTSCANDPAPILMSWFVGWSATSRSPLAGQCPVKTPIVGQRMKLQADFAPAPCPQETRPADRLVLPFS
jgi:hypothetical protein